ncbi:hypothetical protein [uncultured Microbacterium sp.]|uniref:hypothetical protein n=1 Tax=uncultured Microbacterium sp. TaxID=191216 RepID=UPI0035CC17CD
MNDLLAPVRSPDQERQHILSHPPRLGPRPSLVDRLSLRVGLWLLLRGQRRLNRSADHAEQYRVLANERARAERERGSVGEHLLRHVRA